MRQSICLCLLFGILGLVSPLRAGSGHGEHGGTSPARQESMSHEPATGTFSHHAVAEGVRAEFQVMSLAEMKMDDPEGNTHHIMVRFVDEKTGKPVHDVVGKIKVIAPSGKEQVATLKDYGGTFAANFTFSEEGKHGVICLFKSEGKKRVVKFWYPHHGG